jgi:hypothetical protein
MTSPGKRLRREVVAKLRQEGREARDKGVRSQACPHGKPGYPNWQQWQRGWEQRDQELKQHQLEDQQQGDDA